MLTDSKCLRKDSGVLTCLADTRRKKILTAATALQLNPRTDNDKSAPQTLTRRRLGVKASLTSGNTADPKCL